MGRFRIFLLLLFSFASCSSVPEAKENNKHDYVEVEHLKISYLDVFKQEGEMYYIYYYQISCYHCHGIKSKVIDYALNSKNLFYFVEVLEDYGFLSRTKEDTIGVSNPYKAFALMTPQLSKVTSGRISETYIGQEEILNIIEY